MHLHTYSPFASRDPSGKVVPSPVLDTVSPPIPKKDPPVSGVSELTVIGNR